MKNYFAGIIFIILIASGCGYPIRNDLRNGPGPEDVPLTERHPLFRNTHPDDRSKLYDHAKTYYYGEPDPNPPWRMRFRAPENYYDNGGKNWFRRMWDSLRGKSDEFWESETDKQRRWEYYLNGGDPY